MKTTNVALLLAIVLVVSSSDMMAKVSEAACQSTILNPASPCDPATCRKDCAAKIPGGVGTCYGAPYHKGCDSECPHSSSSQLPRKLNQMN